MKKRWLIICTIIVIAILASYLLLPTERNFIYKTTANCPQTATARQIITKSRWQGWWPGKKFNDTVYSFKAYTYRIDKIFLDAVKMTVFNHKDSIKGNLQFTDYGNDSTMFQWTSLYHLPVNPYKRWIEYFEQQKMSNNITSLINDIQKQFNKQEIIYGMKITEETVTDSALISLKNTFSHYPSTEEIYSMIDSLNIYIKKNKGEANNYPMLHVHKNGPNAFETMVAIPTKTKIPSDGKFEQKRMVLGNIVVGEVRGGVQNVLKEEQELDNYVHDYHKLSPAISFQSLITNRLSEQDSTKWITKLYYPVFQ